MFIGSELKAETESPKFIFIISIVSSAFGGVEFGDVSKTSQKNIFWLEQSVSSTSTLHMAMERRRIQGKNPSISVPDHVLRDGCKRLVNPSD